MSLSLEGFSVSIGNRPLVHSVSLLLAPGEAVALVGPSGSGKSLTAAAITGSLPESARTGGTLRIKGKNYPLGAGHRPGVAAVRQDSLTALHPLVRIDRQLIPVLLGSGMAATRAAAAAQAASMLEEVGFTDPLRVLRSFPMELSGGQRQRVCIIQALSCRASFLIADEPTTALDGVARQLVLSALQKAAEAGTGILLITHDVMAAASLCPRTIAIDRGAVLNEVPSGRPAGSAAGSSGCAVLPPAGHAAGSRSTVAA